MPTPNRSRFDVHLPPAFPSKRIIGKLVPAVLRRRIRWVQSSVWQLRKSLGCLDLSLDSGASRRCHRSAVEVSRRRQSCQRRMHYSQPWLTNHARLHQSVRCPPASHAPRRSPSTRRSATRSRRLRDLAERFSARRRSWGSASSFRRLNPFWRLISRFREHLIPHAVRPLFLTDRFRRLPSPAGFFVMIAGKRC